MKLKRILCPVFTGLLSISLLITPTFADDIQSQSGTNEVYDFSSVPYTDTASGGSSSNVGSESTPSDGSENVVDVNAVSDANRYSQLRNAGTGEFRQIGDNIFAEHTDISAEDLLRWILENPYTGSRDTDIDTTPGISPTSQEQDILNRIMRGADPTDLNITWGKHETGLPLIPPNVQMIDPASWHNFPIPILPNPSLTNPDDEQPSSETAAEHWARRRGEIASGNGYADYGLGLGTGFGSMPFALGNINLPDFSLIDFPSMNQRDMELINWMDQTIPNFRDKINGIDWLEEWRRERGIDPGNTDPQNGGNGNDDSGSGNSGNGNENNGQNSGSGNNGSGNDGSGNGFGSGNNSSGGSEGGSSGNSGGSGHAGTSLTDRVAIEHIIEYRVTASRSDVAYLISPVDGEPVKWSVTLQPSETGGSLEGRNVTTDRSGKQLTGTMLSWAFDIPGLYKVVAKQMYQLLKAQSMSYSVCEYWIIPQTGLIIYSHASRSAFGDPSSVEGRADDFNAVYYNFESDLTWDGNTTNYGLRGHTLATYSHLVTESSIIVPAPGFEGFSTRRLQ